MSTLYLVCVLPLSALPPTPPVVTRRHANTTHSHLSNKRTRPHTGAASKLLATVATYPLIVVKSRLQAAAPVAPTESSGSGVGGSCGGKDEAGADKGGSSACRASSLDVLRSILTEEGLPGLYGGMPAKMLQTVVNAALMLSIKEQVRLWTLA
jgi:solute carrier family 25 (peroxisomal adenine nucleotide transporter), member 17